MAYAKSGLTRFAGVVVRLFFCGLLHLTPAAASAPEESAALLRISLPAVVKGYTSYTVTVDSPAAGEIELRLYDSLENPCLVRREPVSAAPIILTQSCARRTEPNAPHPRAFPFRGLPLRWHWPCLPPIPCIWTRRKAGSWNAMCPWPVLSQWKSGI